MARRFVWLATDAITLFVSRRFLDFSLTSRICATDFFISFLFLSANSTSSETSFDASFILSFIARTLFATTSIESDELSIVLS